MQKFVESGFGASGHLFLSFGPGPFGEVAGLLLAEGSGEIPEARAAERAAEQDAGVDLPDQQPSLGRRAFEVIGSGGRTSEQQQRGACGDSRAEGVCGEEAAETARCIEFPEGQRAASGGGRRQCGAAHGGGQNHGPQQCGAPAREAGQQAARQDAGTEKAPRSPESLPSQQPPREAVAADDAGDGADEDGGDEARIGTRVEERAGDFEKPVVRVGESVDLADAGPRLVDAEEAQQRKQHGGSMPFGREKDAQRGVEHRRLEQLVVTRRGGGSGEEKPGGRDAGEQQRGAAVRGIGADARGTDEENGPGQQEQQEGALHRREGVRPQLLRRDVEGRDEKPPAGGGPEQEHRPAEKGMVFPHHGSGRGLRRIGRKIGR